MKENNELEKLFEAVSNAEQTIRHYKNQLLSSLSCAGRSHDDDAVPAQQLNDVLTSLNTCKKAKLSNPSKEFLDWSHSAEYSTCTSNIQLALWEAWLAGQENLGKHNIIRFSKSNLFIFDCTDKPCEKLIVQSRGGKLFYICPDAQYQLQGADFKHDTTVIEDFGIRLSLHGRNQLWGTHFPELCIAKYRDGSNRKWQGASDFVIDVDDVTLAVLHAVASKNVVI